MTKDVVGFKKMFAKNTNSSIRHLYVNLYYNSNQEKLSKRHLLISFVKNMLQTYLYVTAE